eukprot:gene5161-biopygen10048
MLRLLGEQQADWVRPRSAPHAPPPLGKVMSTLLWKSRTHGYMPHESIPVFKSLIPTPHRLTLEQRSLDSGQVDAVASQLDHRVAPARDAEAPRGPES